MRRIRPGRTRVRYRTGGPIACELATVSATKLGTLLAQAAKPDSVRVLGPAPAPIERIKQRYRWQVLIKARERHELRAVLAQVAACPVHDGVRISIDIDPFNML